MRERRTGQILRLCLFTSLADFPLLLLFLSRFSRRRLTFVHPVRIWSRKPTPDPRRHPPGLSYPGPRRLRPSPCTMPRCLRKQHLILLSSLPLSPFFSLFLSVLLPCPALFLSFPCGFHFWALRVLLLDTQWSDARFTRATGSPSRRQLSRFYSFT